MTDEPAVEYEFGGLIVQAVVLRRVDGRLAAETINQPIPVRVFTAEDAGKLISEMESQIAELNAAAKPNRAARRSRAR